LTHHLNKIDLLRGVAILLVFLFHCHLFFFDPDAVGNSGLVAHFSLKGLLIALSPSSVGWSGVPLFFIISGFLIHLGFVKKPEAFGLAAFFSKRFWRIYPPYWLTLLALILISFFSGHGVGITNAVLHFFTLYNFSDRYMYGYNPSYWSLATEVQLYLLYPVLLFIRKKLGIANCFLVVCGISVTSLVLGIAFNNFGTSYAYLYNPFQLWFIWAAGAFYAEAVYAKQLRIFKKGGFGFFMLFYLVLIGCTLFKTTGYFTFFAATAAFITLFDWALHTPAIKVDRWPAKLMVALGLCSYSFYLIHQPYLDKMLIFFGGTLTSGLRLAAVLPVFAIIFILSYILYRVVEMPSIAFGKSLRKRSS